MNFKITVLLKRKPYYVMALDEEDASRICTNLKDDVVGILASDSSIVFKDICTKISFLVPEIKMIENTEEEDGQQVLEEIINEPKGSTSRLTDNSDRDPKDS